MAISWSNEMLSRSDAAAVLARFRVLVAARKEIPSDVARVVELSLRLHAGASTLLDARDSRLIRAALALRGSAHTRAASIAAIGKSLRCGGGIALAARGVPAEALDWINDAQRYAEIPGTARHVYRIIAPSLTCNPCSGQPMARNDRSHGDLPLSRHQPR